MENELYVVYICHIQYLLLYKEFTFVTILFRT